MSLLGPYGVDPHLTNVMSPARVLLRERPRYLFLPLGATSRICAPTRAEKGGAIPSEATHVAGTRGAASRLVAGPTQVSTRMSFPIAIAKSATRSRRDSLPAARFSM